MADTTEDRVAAARARLAAAESGEDPQAAEALRRAEEADRRAEERAARGLSEIPGGQPPSQPVNPATRVQRDGSVGVNATIRAELEKKWDELEKSGRIPAGTDKEKWMQENALNYTSPTMNTAANEQAVRSGVAMDSAQINNDQNAYNAANAQAQAAQQTSEASEGRDVSQPQPETPSATQTPPAPVSAPGEPETSEEERAIDQIAEQQSEQSGDDSEEAKESWKNKIKKLYEMFKNGQIKPGTDAYFKANAIATMAYNIGEMMDKNMRNSLWSHIKSGNFENPEFKKSFYEQQQEADIAQEHERTIDTAADVADTAAKDEYEYNDKIKMIENSEWYKKDPKVKASIVMAQKALNGESLTPEEYLQITDIDGEIENLKAGRDREASLESLMIKAQSLQNASDEIKLKYLERFQQVELRGEELNNVMAALGGVELNINIPGMGGVKLNGAVVFNAATAMGTGVSQFIDGLKSGNPSFIDAFKAAGGAITG